eukprot:11474670-Prorocentrum_lima.AAC.1
MKVARRDVLDVRVVEVNQDSEKTGTSLNPPASGFWAYKEPNLMLPPFRNFHLSDSLFLLVGTICENVFLDRK